jgi:hypothetical protein
MLTVEQLIKELEKHNAKNLVIVRTESTAAEVVEIKERGSVTELICC